MDEALGEATGVVNGVLPAAKGAILRLARGGVAALLVMMVGMVVVEMGEGLGHLQQVPRANGSVARALHGAAIAACRVVGNPVVKVKGLAPPAHLVHEVEHDWWGSAKQHVCEREQAAQLFAMSRSGSYQGCSRWPLE